MFEVSAEDFRYTRWDGSNFVRLSLADFLTQAKKNLANVVAALDAVQNVYTLFNEQETVWPDQCDYAVRSMEMIRRPVSDFCVLMDRTAHLPTSVIPLRYELITELSYVKEQTQFLTSTMTLFRTSCKNPSRQSIKQRHEILHRLELLVQGGEDITQHSNALFNQVLLQEHL